MRLFEDAELKKPLEKIRFGKVEAGHQKILTIYLLNDSKAVLSNLVYDFPALPPTEVLLVEGPITIQQGKSAPLTVTWKPSMTFKKALILDLLIRAEEVYLAEETYVIEREKGKP